MKRKVLIAHANKTGEDLRRLERVVKEHFPNDKVVTINYRELSKRVVVSNAMRTDILVISGFGRLIEENGVNALLAARKANTSVYFAMIPERDGFYDRAAYKWACLHGQTSYLEKPTLVEMAFEDEIHTLSSNKKAVVLPTYAM